MKLDFETAKALVLERLNKDYHDPDDSLVLLDEMTITKPYGWVFFCASRPPTETGSFLHMLGGNGPIVVEAESGEISRLGSGRAPETEVAEFERKRGLSPVQVPNH